MKTSNTGRKVAETVVGAAIGAAIAGPAGAVAGGLLASQVAAHTPHAAETNPTHKPAQPDVDDPIVHAQLKRILVPVDFSPPSRRALRFAREWALCFGSQVCLLHVIEPINTLGILGSDRTALLPKSGDLHEAMGAELRHLSCEDFPNAVKVAVELRDGAAHVQIATVAREWKADLIIIATHGRTGLSHALLGSTAEQVIRHGPCPVLALRRAAGD